ncbi:MAG: methyltransferase domain-containing protein [Phycisphaerales bacterium]|nr:methyltransferase domain-containing protein [Phycisphaerales bacterium]
MMSVVPTTHVYHRHLDPESQDSLARLARQIRPGSRVLDLGTGPGVLGRYLSETLGCAVDGVEYNPVAVAEAGPWYRHLECADLESITLSACFAGQSYDFIICADVLEHLRQPGAILAQLPALLAPQGRVLLSVPNVAYAGLIAELLAGDFRYRPEGLLDNTHLRFFTHASLLRLLEEHGLRTVALEATIMELHHSEFTAHWIDGGWAETLPVEVIRALLDRPEALVYQFIVSAAPANEADAMDAANETHVIAVPADAVAAAQATLTARLAARSLPVRTALTVAIVSYAPDLTVLRTVLERLGQALQLAEGRGQAIQMQLLLVDNGPGPDWREPLRNLLETVEWPVPIELKLLSGHGNIGYGAGHNVALNHSTGEFHLILNPDVLLEEDALIEGLAFLVAHSEAGLIAPAVWDGSGQRRDLCKRYPTLLDLALRGFAPSWLRQRFQQRLDRYELRDQIGDTVYWNPPIVSGCFMLCRRSVLEQVGGFRPEYFLYFEDFDLSLRLAAVTRLAYVPTVRVVHLGGHAARKGLRHIRLFLRAAVKFFNRHGWRWW